MKTLLAAAVALSMLTGTMTTAYADNDRGGHERHDDHDNDHRDHRDDHHDHDGHDGDHHDDRYDHRDYRAGPAHDHYHRDRYIPPRGYHVRAWRHGDHLPRAYYESRYVVRDYHVYHLSAPPRGYHWVRVNNDVVLAAITSGLVVSVVNGLFY